MFQKLGRSTKELWIITIARGSKDVVSDYVADGSPGKNINNVETHRIIRFQQTHIFLSSGVACLEVRHSILLRQSLFRHVLPLEVEENKPSQEQGQTCAQADHQLRVQLSFDATVELLLGGDGSAGEDGCRLGGDVCGLVEWPQALEGWCRQQGGSHTGLMAGEDVQWIEEGKSKIRFGLVIVCGKRCGKKLSRILRRGLRDKRFWMSWLCFIGWFWITDSPSIGPL